MGGGSGLKYAASTIIYLSKSKEKDGKEVVGNIIKCETKSLALQRRTAKLQHVFSMTNADLTAITDYWNWVNSTEYSSGRNRLL